MSSRSHVADASACADSTFDPLDLTAPLVFLPVRHHSPACAQAVRWAIETARPRWVLVEGPADYNEHRDELALEHRLPIAIYSYARTLDGTRRGAYYPFCEYSPEWQAILAAREVGAEWRFIDLPFADVARVDEAQEEADNRYADGELRRSAYVATLLTKLGHESFDGLWDELFEVDPDLPPAELLRRCYAFCTHARILDRSTRPVDPRREAFMADEVRRAQAEDPGQALVVTGGFHSSALFARLCGAPFSEPLEPSHVAVQPLGEGEERGISLTPYSYLRLDALRGYEAGMPNPGFYERAWRARQAGHALDSSALAAEVVRAMRKRKQAVSAADAIALEATARQLAALRGMPGVWRRELLDAVTGALIKEPLDPRRGHPLLSAVNEVLRGDRRGRLDSRTRLPPLVKDVERLLDELELSSERMRQELTLVLGPRAERACAQSRVLHRLRILGVSGVVRAGGSEAADTEQLDEFWERWELRWSPDRDSSLIEAAIFGPTLVEAAASCLADQARELERDAAGAAGLLLRASLAGLTAEAVRLRRETERLIDEDARFVEVGGALRSLFFLYRYDSALGTRGAAEVGELVARAWARALWLLEAQGSGVAQGDERATLSALSALLETCERSGPELDLAREELVQTLTRVARESGAAPLLRGACMGALWTLDAADVAALSRALQSCKTPEDQGEFLAGLLRLAREAVQHEQALLLQVDEVLLGMDEESFLAALPAFRLAFSGLSPREKHHLGLTLLQATRRAHPSEGGDPGDPQRLDEADLAPLEVDLASAEVALAFEARVFATARRFGLRTGAAEPGDDPPAPRGEL